MSVGSIERLDSPMPLDSPALLGLPMPVDLPDCFPAQVVGGACHNKAWDLPAHTPHPQDSSKLWCTKNRHYIKAELFSGKKTCENCRKTARQNAALKKQTEAELAAKIEIANLVAETVDTDIVASTTNKATSHIPKVAPNISE